MRKTFSISLISFLLIIGFCCPVQSGPVKDLSKPSPTDQPKLPDYLPDKQDKDVILPPQPEIKGSAPATPLFVLTDVVFEGNTVFSDVELAKTASKFIQQKVSLADLEELRYQVTRLYVDKGYPNSGAILKPGQKVTDGVITYTILEGRLNDIRISGNDRLHPEYIRQRAWPDPTLPFNTLVLQEQFQMLLQDPLIKRMQGKILPGTRPGEAVLDLGITREPPYEMHVSADNHTSPSLGAEHYFMGGTIRNLTGWGDALFLQAGLTEGTGEFSGSFSIPLNAQNTLLTLDYSRSKNNVVEAPLDDLDVDSQIETAKISIMHPFLHSLQRRFDLGVALETQKNETAIMDEPFSFSEGYVDGKARVTALRLIQSFQDRGLNHALVLRSTFSFGVDLFGATLNSGDTIDSRFTTWLGQFQYAHRLGEKLGQVIFKGNAQLAADNLISMEQFSVGGATTVRGYRENEVVRDNGYTLSVEWQVPVWQKKAANGDVKLLQIAPFIDYGAGWNKGERFNESDLPSAGVGLLWTSPMINAQLYVAHGFEDVPAEEEYNLQDDGIHFNISIKLF